MTPIGKNTPTTGMAPIAIKTSTIKQQTLATISPPPRAKSDPSSTALTIHKVSSPDTGKIEFGSKRFESALIREVSMLRTNPKKYAKVLAAHVESNPKKFNLKDPKFMASLSEAVTALKTKGKEMEAGKVTLPQLKDNPERGAIASKGMGLLASRGLDLVAARGGDGKVNTGNSDFLDDFIDHEPIEHLRKGGTDGNGEATKGSDNAISALKKKSGAQAMFHATDLENLSASTADSVTVRDVIAGWLIDHGVDTKGHRNALLNAGITEIGVGTSTATIMDKTGREVTVKITGMNFYGIRDFSTGELIENPPTK
jgi:hypothetical protein